MKRVHIIGRRNHGKTTFCVELIEELTRRGLRVGSIKHTPHAYEVDTPGKDSHRHRMAGAQPAALVSGLMVAVFCPVGESGDYMARLAPLYHECDLVMVEGDKTTVHASVILEIWREGVGGEPLCRSIDHVAAVVTDDSPDVPCPLWPRRDISAVADLLLKSLNLRA